MDEYEAALSPIEDVISDFANGRMIILLDDVSRENEGDLTVATEKITAEQVSFMMREARGQICISIPSMVAERLNLPLQVLNNASQFQTPFAISLDSVQCGAKGVTAKNRAFTMHRIIDEASQPDDFVNPGHVFPLIVNPAGVLARHGQTEGSHDLASLAGVFPSGVICEILNEDGTMAKGEQLIAYAKKHQLKMTTVLEIAKYRIRHEVLLEEVECKTITTDFGQAKAHVFKDIITQQQHVALLCGKNSTIPILYVHQEDTIKDVFESQNSCERYFNIESSLILYLRLEEKAPLNPINVAVIIARMLQLLKIKEVKLADGIYTEELKGLGVKVC